MKAFVFDEIYPKREQQGNLLRMRQISIET